MTREQVESIAAEYAGAPLVAASPRVRAGYDGLAVYALSRFVDAVREGWTFWPEHTGEAPMLLVAHSSRELGVYDRHHDHPLLSDRANFAFRAVHDVFGHRLNSERFADVHDFTFAGECAAATSQAADIDVFGRIAGWSTETILDVRAAAWTEIVGQAAYFEVHGEFPVQKALFLTSRFGR